MKSQMPVFVVSLSDARARRAEMLKHLNALGIEFEFVDAIRGSALPEEERVRLNPTRNMSNGAIGCYMSHIEIYKRMEREEHAVSLILEDDALLMPAAKRIVEGGCSSLAFDYCFLGCDDRGDQGFVDFDADTRTELLPGIPIYRLSSGPYCTHGYLITLNGARRRLSCAYPLRTAIDHYRYLPYRPDIWATVPLLTYVNELSASGSMSSLNWSGLQAWSRTYWWYYVLRDSLTLRWPRKAIAANRRSKCDDRMWRPMSSSFRVPAPWNRIG